jgi:hypothetical protein
MDRRRLLRWSGAASALGLDASRWACARAARRTRPVRCSGRSSAPPLPRATGAAARHLSQRRAEVAGGHRARRHPRRTRLVYAGGASLLGANHVDQISLTGLTLEGNKRALPPREGLVHFEFCRGVRIADCAILGSGGHGIMFANITGEVTGSIIVDAADVALWSYDAQGLTIAGNTVNNAGNNGIQIIRSAAGHDGTMVLDNRIDATNNRLGGSGQYGNAINAFRAGDVIVRGNIIRQCAFSGIRGNTASNIQIVGNTVHQAGWGSPPRPGEGAITAAIRDSVHQHRDSGTKPSRKEHIDELRRSYPGMTETQYDEARQELAKTGIIPPDWSKVGRPMSIR